MPGAGYSYGDWHAVFYDPAVLILIYLNPLYPAMQKGLGFRYSAPPEEVLDLPDIAVYLRAGNRQYIAFLPRFQAP